MVPTAGIEPATYWLQVSCSTNWAKSAIYIIKVNPNAPITTNAWAFSKLNIFFINK